MVGAVAEPCAGELLYRRISSSFSFLRGDVMVKVRVEAAGWAGGQGGGGGG